MNGGLLLDTHSLFWLTNGAPMLVPALPAMDRAACAKQLFISHISLWETGVASQKKNVARRPNLGGVTISQWFKSSVSIFDLRVLSLSPRIALEAAEVPAFYGSGDPGDCFLIATARIRKLSLVTRDQKMIDLSTQHPDYLSVIPC